MKRLLNLCLMLLMYGTSTAQFYNDAAISSDGSMITDYSTQWFNGSAGSFTGQNGNVFQHYGPATATFVNNGTFGSGLGGMTDQFLGPAGSPGDQEIGGSIRPAFHNLVLNNGNSAAINITNASGVMVTNSATFSNGLTTTVRSSASAGAIQFATGSSYSGFLSATRHVNGYTTKTGNTVFAFPVGDGIQYRPLTYTASPPISTDALSVAYWNGDPGLNIDPTGGPHNRTSLSSSGTPGSTKIASVSPVGFWDWVTVSGTSAISFSISIPDMSGTGGYAIPADMRVVGWNLGTGQWENLSGAKGATSNTAGTLMAGTVNNMASYSAIAIGSVAGIPLPITLLNFTAVKKGCTVQLQWQTLSDHSTEYFVIERSENALIWTEIRNIRTAQMSGIVSLYQIVDETPRNNKNYYRLKIVEKDGHKQYGPVASASPDCNPETAIRILPNPFMECLTIEGLTSGSGIRVLQADGRLMYSGLSDAMATIATGGWPCGAYTIRVFSGAEVYTRQIIKK